MLLPASLTMPSRAGGAIPRCRRMNLCSRLPAGRVSVTYTASMRSPLPVMRSGADEMVRSCGAMTPSSGHSLMTRLSAVQGQQSGF